VLALLSVFPAAFAQSPQAPPRDQGDVIRINTDLVQTDVMVFDKQGHFIDNLRREDFELRIDGKPRPIQFFERVTAGRNEEAQLAAARGLAASSNSGPKGSVPLDRGRTVFFYVDDLHLGLQSVAATRRLISKFLDDEMGQNDEVAITSASGQIGFLQQLTDQKFVLRAALERLKSRPYSVRDFERPTMTEYQGLLIDSYDRDVLDYFIDETIKMNPGTPRDMAAAIVRERARAVLDQAARVTTNTLSGLEGLVRSTSKLSGRKLIFFISDGFFLDHRNSDSGQQLLRITSAAARNGVVIYSMDARGLVASLTDASQDVAFDPLGRLQRSMGSELLASQDSLNALARDTGGKAVFNTNDLRPGLTQALKETSLYYLLAWKPDPEAQNGGERFRRMEVSVTNRRDLVVRVRRGFFDIEPSPPVSKKETQKNAATPKTPEAEVAEALRSLYPEHALPLSLTLSYVNTPEKGAILWASMQIAGEFATFGLENGKNQALVDVAGFFYDDRGQPGAKFKDRITITAPTAEAARSYRRNVVYTSPVFLPPGLYQVRVAARDQHSGRVGSAHAWIEVPDLKSGELAMSSLLLGERQESAVNLPASSQSAPTPTGLSVDHRFRSSSYLRFLLFVYNATVAAAGAKPDLVAQVQIVRDNQPVITTALKKIEPPATADVARLPYAAEVPLSQLSPGLYLLQINVIDRVSKRSTSQQTRFEVY
jgi:VWFA-related protein